MALDWLNLLGQASGAQLGNPQEEDGIEVIGKPDPSSEILYNDMGSPEPPRYAAAPDREAITPRYVLNDDRMPSPESERPEKIERSGLFGAKGTLRDILGILGDAFLVQGGNERIYGPQRQKEKEADALFGFTDDPYQAMERLATVNPGAAEQLWKDYQEAETSRGTLASQEGNRQDLARDRQYTNVTQARNQVARWLAAAKTPDQLAFVLQQSQRLASELGIPVTQLGIPENNTLTEDQRSVLASGDMTVNQQVQVPFTERRVATGEQNAESYARSVDRPRPVARPRADTDQEYFRSIAAKQERGEPLTQGEQDFYKKYTQGTRTSRIGTPPPPPPAGQPRSRFRRVN